MNDVLQQFRSQIDALDNDMIRLLHERLAVVQQVGEYKKKYAPGVFPIRPAREASMLRRITSVFADSHFSSAAAAQIWRIIIGTSTALEAKLTVSVYTPEGENDLFWLAREYFGPAAVISRQPHINRVIGDVMDGKTAIGVVPSIAANGEDHWWINLLQSAADAPKIFAKIPFVQDAEKLPCGLAFARLAPEDSGDDVSLYALQRGHEVSLNRLQTALAQVQLRAQCLGVATPSPDQRTHLIEIEGFIAPEHTGFQQFLGSFGTSLHQVYFLGAYAVPFSIV